MAGAVSGPLQHAQLDPSSDSWKAPNPLETRAGVPAATFPVSALWHKVEDLPPLPSSFEKLWLSHGPIDIWVIIYNDLPKKHGDVRCPRVIWKITNGNPLVHSQGKKNTPSRAGRHQALKKFDVRCLSLNWGVPAHHVQSFFRWKGIDHTLCPSDLNPEFPCASLYIYIPLYIYILVGGIPTPMKMMEFVSWDHSQHIWKVIKFMF